MPKINTIGVDLAKNAIQSAVVSPTGKQLLNKELTRVKFAEFLVKQKPSLVAFEACSSAHYWARYAKQHGHQVKIIPAKAVAPFRQGHKTDRNDALAIAEAAIRPNIKDSPLKSVEQQGLQAIQRSRELLVQEKVALSNHLRGLLMEFGVVIPKGWAALEKQIPRVIEDGENDLPDLYRPTLHCLFERYCFLKRDIEFLDQQVKLLVNQNDACRRLMDMEGIGPISALLLFATLGTGTAFKNGREFSSYIGLTHKQHSSGGKAHLIGISRQVANRRLRSVLIQGARSYAHKLKDPNTPKQQWLWRLIQRAGYGKAAVALANKNVRTAWAMLTQGAEYDRTFAHGLKAA